MNEEFEELIEECLGFGVDPFPIIAEELYKIGYTVEEPDAS